MKRVVVLTGAGMSADSGIKTFRDENGLWEGHDVMEVASPEGFSRQPELVLDFYNQRRRQLKSVIPNAGHIALKELENHFQVAIVTQNVDDLHERAGSQHVLHLHGELRKVRSTGPLQKVYPWEEDLILGQMCEDGYQLRPHIVWFGEGVPLLETASVITSKADIVIIVGTSLQVYPAASLVHYRSSGVPVYLIDPRPSIGEGEWPGLTIIRQGAERGLPILVSELIDSATGSS